MSTPNVHPKRLVASLAPATDAPNVARRRKAFVFSMVHPDPFRGDDTMDDAVRLAVRVLHQCNRLPAGRFRKRLLRDAVNEISSALELNILEARKDARIKALENSKPDTSAVRDVSRTASRNSRRRRRVSMSSSIDNASDVGSGLRRKTRAHSAITTNAPSSGDDSDVIAVAMDDSTSHSSKHNSLRPRRSRRNTSRRSPPGQLKPREPLLHGSQDTRSSLDSNSAIDSNSDSKTSLPKRRSSRIACAAAAAVHSEANAEEAKNAAVQEAEIENVEIIEQPPVSDESDWSDIELAIPVIRPRPYIPPKPLVSDWASRTPILSTDDEDTDVEADEFRRANRYAQLLLNRFEERMKEKENIRAKAIRDGNIDLMEISEPETESDKNDADWQPEADWNTDGISDIAVPLLTHPNAPHQASTNARNLYNTQPHLHSVQQLQAQAAASSLSRYHIPQAPMSAVNWSQGTLSRMLGPHQHPRSVQNFGSMPQPNALFNTSVLNNFPQSGTHQPPPNVASESPLVWSSGTLQSVPGVASYARHIAPANHVPINASYSQPVIPNLSQREVHARFQGYRGTINDRVRALEVSRMQAQAKARAQAKLRLQMQMQGRMNPQPLHPSPTQTRRHITPHLDNLAQTDPQLHAHLQARARAHSSQLYLPRRAGDIIPSIQVSPTLYPQTVADAYVAAAPIMPPGSINATPYTAQSRAPVQQIAQNTIPSGNLPNTNYSVIQAQAQAIGQLMARTQPPLSQAQSLAFAGPASQSTYQMHSQRNQTRAGNFQNVSSLSMIPALQQSLTVPIATTQQNITPRAPTNYIATPSFVPQLTEHSLILQNIDGFAANQKQFNTSISAPHVISNRVAAAHRESSQSLVNSIATGARRQYRNQFPSQSNEISEQFVFSEALTGPERFAQSGLQIRVPQNVTRNAITAVPDHYAATAVNDVGLTLHQTWAVGGGGGNNASISGPSNVNLIPGHQQNSAAQLVSLHRAAAVSGTDASMIIPSQAASVLQSGTRSTPVVTSTFNNSRIVNATQAQVRAEALAPGQGTLMNNPRGTSEDVVTINNFLNSKAGNVADKVSDAVGHLTPHQLESAPNTTNATVIENTNRSVEHTVERNSSDCNASQVPKNSAEEVASVGINVEPKGALGVRKLDGLTSANDSLSSNAVAENGAKPRRGVRRFVGLNRLNSTPRVKSESVRQDRTPDEIVKDVQSSNSVGASIMNPPPDEQLRRSYHLRSSK